MQTNTNTKIKKAYTVTDGNDGWAIVFDTNSASARRNGANEIGCDWEDIDTCRRSPEFDQYAESGKVPCLVRIENGWWYECSCCGRTISSDMASDIAGEGLDPDDFTPIETNNAIYCGKLCESLENAAERRRENAIAAFFEVLDARFQGYISAQVYISSDGLISDSKYGASSASIIIPNCDRPIHWDFGASTVGLFNGDREVAEEFLAKCRGLR